MRNVKVLLLSILGLLFIVLTFVLNPWFIAGAIIIMLINQRELMKKPSKNN
jgi:cellulose synthase/poly-beta-1,6-N-acetylglucosamine synthase-like glycosyltransferase